MSSPGTTPATRSRYTLHITRRGPELAPADHHHTIHNMNTTTLRAAAARVYSLLSTIDWLEVTGIVADGLRILWSVVQLLAAALVLAAEITYEHRAQIRAALVAAIARTYIAGITTRRAIHALSSRSARLVAAQPLPALAPITATLAAAREALERLVRRLYPVAA